MARTGENTKEVIDRVKEKIRQIEPGLPPGVRIVPFYDRSELIEATVDTLRHALIEEIILVTLAHVIFLMHFRSILIVTLPLPLAVLCRSCSCTTRTSLRTSCRSPASLSRLECWSMPASWSRRTRSGISKESIRATGTGSGDRARARQSWSAAPSSFSMAIILLAFVPVFALTGQEGKLFHPLAFAKDVCHGERDGHRAHADPGALHAAAAGEVPFGGPIP